MFERFTERARQVIVEANKEALSHNHVFITTGHLLLGLIREKEGVGARVLEVVGVTEESARQQLVAILNPSLSNGERADFSSRAKGVLKMALNEALSMGHSYIGTEHLLLALQMDGLLPMDERPILADNPDDPKHAISVSTRILAMLEVDLEEMRTKVRWMLARPTRGETTNRPKPAAEWLSENYTHWHLVEATGWDDAESLGEPVSHSEFHKRFLRSKIRYEWKPAANQQPSTS